MAGLASDRGAAEVLAPMRMRSPSTTTPAKSKTKRSRYAHAAAVPLEFKPHSRKSLLMRVIQGKMRRTVDAHSAIDAQVQVCVRTCPKDCSLPLQDYKRLSDGYQLSSRDSDLDATRSPVPLFTPHVEPRRTPQNPSPHRVVEPPSASWWASAHLARLIGAAAASTGKSSNLPRRRQPREAAARCLTARLRFVSRAPAVPARSGHSSPRVPLSPRDAVLP